jgi:hypothetical protein
MKRIQWIILTVLAILLLLSPSLQAEFVAQQHEKIQGIGELGMMVVIEGLGWLRNGFVSVISCMQT